MKKNTILLLLMLVLLPIQAQESGIKFFHGTWNEAVAKAKQEKKNIFIDFFTEWCGPCLNMALKVFPLPEVGEAYNSRFICVKIDAEKGEGVALAKKYGVYSYPSYVFVNPETQEMIHRSGGNKPAADFISDIKGAMDSKLSSIYLSKKFESGNYDIDFLIDYMMGLKYGGNRYQTKNFEKLIAKGGKLTDRRIWDVYVSCVNGYDNPYVKQISDNYSLYVKLYGKEAVDEKLSEATAYAPVPFLNSLCSFSGKEYNIKMAKMSALFRDKSKWDEAWNYVDSLIADTTLDKAKFVKQLSFYTRVEPRYNDKDLSFDQLVRKIRYTRYVAYNMYDRDDAFPHYTYAKALEYLIQRSLSEGKSIPSDLFAEPKYGKKEYDMRHPLLKTKPSYRKK